MKADDTERLGGRKGRSNNHSSPPAHTVPHCFISHVLQKMSIVKRQFKGRAVSLLMGTGSFSHSYEKNA